jgi:hypothetical protein
LISSYSKVIDGHLPLKAAKKLGMTELPVILSDAWTPAQEKAFRLMESGSVTWADWDTDLVALEIQAFKGMDFDLSLIGFAPMEIDDFRLDGDRSSVRRFV